MAKVDGLGARLSVGPCIMQSSANRQTSKNTCGASSMPSSRTKAMDVQKASTARYNTSNNAHADFATKSVSAMPSTSIWEDLTFTRRLRFSGLYPHQTVKRQKIKGKDGVEFMQKRLPGGRGVRLNLDGTFKGFID